MEPSRKKLKIDASTIILNKNAVPVRKVCFSFWHEDVASEQITATSFLSFIIQIGKIESINLQSDSASTCGPVIFRQPEHAAQLLRQQHLICAGADIRIWEAIGQPTHGTNILDLNDHCLRKVFSNLYVKDLASVAEVNQRFKVNAQAIRTPNGISCRKKCRALFPPSDA